MKRMGMLLLCALLLSALAAARDSSAEPASNGPGARLRTDLAKAVENGHLTDEQKSMIQNAASVLRDAAKARQNGQRVDRSAVQKAFSDIKKVADSDAFQPEDKQAVKADLEAMKEKASESRKGRRRGLFRGLPGGGAI